MNAHKALERAERRAVRRWLRENARDILLVVLWIGLLLAACSPVFAAEVSLAAIAQIESSNRPYVIGDGGRAFGRYQITAPVIREHGRYTVAEVKASPSKQEEVARWYFTKRIPQMLRAFGKPVTTRNILIAYNAGIAYVAKSKPLPKVTRRYLEKYAALTGRAA